MVRFTIDGRTVEAKPGQTILEVASAQGIRIPTLCYHKALPPEGACRLCVVEIVGRPRLAASCSYPIEEGIEVKTNSPRVVRARRLVIELLYLRCPEAPEIQELAREFGVDEARLNRFIPDNESCILCGLCVRMCKERMGVNAVDFVNRGYRRKVSPPFQHPSPICLTCGACQSVCPVGAKDLSGITLNTPRPLLSEYDAELAQRGPIYIPFPQAIPKVPVIDPDTCLRLQRGVCGVCEAFCEAQAINYDMKPEHVELKVGAVVVATGLKLYDLSKVPEYGHGRLKNVVSAMAFERLTSASGPTGGELKRPSDGKIPHRLAFIQCVGSRDFRAMPYCSSACCMHATKEAIMANEHHPDTESTIFYIDMRAVGKGFQEYILRAQREYKVSYIRARPSRVEAAPETENPIVHYEDTVGGERRQMEVDMVVLAQAMAPSSDGAFGVEVDDNGFIEIPDMLLHPVDTTRPGIFACGYCQSPRDIPDSVVQGSAAAARAAEVLGE